MSSQALLGSSNHLKIRKKRSGISFATNMPIKMQTPGGICHFPMGLGEYLTEYGSDSQFSRL